MESHDEVRVAGTLRFDPTTGGELSLIGGLPLGDLGQPARIFGEVHGSRLLTLDPAYMQCQQADFERVQSQEWAVSSVLEGIHCDAESEAFSEVRIATALLPKWLDGPSPKLDLPENSVRRAILSIDIPEPLECTVDGLGQFEVGWGDSYTTGYATGEVRLTPSVVVRFDAPRTLDEVWQAVCVPVALLTTFATGATDSLAKVSLTPITQDVHDPFARAVIWHNSTWATRPTFDEGQTRRTGYLLPFGTVAAQFGSIISRWFELYGEYRGTLLDFFAGRFGVGRPHAEDSFARAVRCLEAFHRTRFGGTHLSDGEYEAILKAALASAGGPAEREFLHMRLNNEPTLRERLDTLIEHAGTPISTRRRDNAAFVSRVVNTRNAFAHNLPRGSKCFDDEGMVEATMFLEFMMYALILRELGLSATEVMTRIIAVPGWRWIAVD